MKRLLKLFRRNILVLLSAVIARLDVLVLVRWRVTLGSPRAPMRGCSVSLCLLVYVVVCLTPVLRTFRLTVRNGAGGTWLGTVLIQCAILLGCGVVRGL